MRRRGNDFGVIPRSFVAKMKPGCRIAAASINCNFATGRARKLRQNKKMERNPKCPMPSPRITSVCISRRREAGRRSSSCTNSRPTTPTGSRRCATSRAATAASPIRRAAIRRPTCRLTPDVYTYKHFYTDALAVLDHLEIAKAHFIGLSMGSYSSLQVGLNAPERALSMTLAAVGSGSNLENLDAFRKQCRANAEQYEAIGSVEVAKVDARGAEPDSVPAEGPARPRRFLCRAGAA